MMDRTNLCDEDCNHCKLVGSRMLTKIFNTLYQKLGNEVYKVVQAHCPNLTVCARCHIDDFSHSEGCYLTGEEDGR